MERELELRLAETVRDLHVHVLGTDPANLSFFGKKRNKNSHARVIVVH